MCSNSKENYYLGLSVRTMYERCVLVDVDSIWFSVIGNSMSIHPKKVENDTIPLQFVLNLYSIFIVLRHVKIQNFRLLPLIVFELWDFKFGGFLSKMGVV